MDVLGEDVLPGTEIVVERILDALSLEGESTDLVGLLDLINLSALLIEVLQLLFEVIEVRVVVPELLKLILGLAGPEPRVSGEALKELADGVFGTLDGTGQEQDDLNDLLVLGNPVVERLLLLFGDTLLEP